MRLITTTTMLAMMAFSSALAADYSVSITPEGINLYSITHKGVDLVEGSPHVLPQPGVAYPLLPALVAISPAHDFVYVVYEEPPVYFYAGGDLHDVNVVGLKITAKGLVKKWSYAMNMDPHPMSERWVMRRPLTDASPSPSSVLFVTQW